MDKNQLKTIIDAALLAAARPLHTHQLEKLFAQEHTPPNREEIRACLTELQSECEAKGYELVQVASGFRYQVRQSLEPWISHLWEEKPARYSRAAMETLALIVYRQPITRAEIEDIRGVSVSTHIIKTLLEREWIRVLGHKDVPGRPALYGSTRNFLDYFNLRSLDELPNLADLTDPDILASQLDLDESDHRSQDQTPDEAGQDEPAQEDTTVQQEPVVMALSSSNTQH
jgi:segregation and condensation protein B